MIISVKNILSIICIIESYLVILLENVMVKESQAVELATLENAGKIYKIKNRKNNIVSTKVLYS